MPRRRWKCFREFKTKGWQKKRSRSHRKEFVRGGADPKIRMYDVGNRKMSVDKFDVIIGLMMTKTCRISHLTLEAIRVSINRRLTDAAGKDNFHLRIRAKPYDVYREHAMMAFAGADRISSGMRKSFGRPIGRCCRLRPKQIICDAGVNLKNIEAVKKAFLVAATKICRSSKVLLISASKPEYIPKVPLPYLGNYV